MLEALHHVCTQAIKAYPTCKRINWVDEWPGQIVLVVSCIFWTQQVGQAMASGQPGALKGVADANTADLNDIVAKVRADESVTTLPHRVQPIRA